jgi:hypothetical protein
MNVNYQNANNRLDYLYKQALNLAENAVNEDNNCNVKTAINFYLDVTKVY